MTLLFSVIIQGRRKLRHGLFIAVTILSRVVNVVTKPRLVLITELIVGKERLHRISVFTVGGAMTDE